MPRRRQTDLATNMLAARAASLRYERGWSNIDIAAELDISRFRVARLLDLARDLRIVRFNVSLPDGIQSDLSEQLRRAYWLDECIVVDSVPTVTELRDQLGRAAARLLRDLVSEDDVLGIAWGRTLSALVRHIYDLPPAPVVQLTGIAGDSVENSLELVRVISGRTGGPAYPLYAPMVLPDTATLNGLRRQPAVQQVLQLHRHVTRAVVAIGSWNPPDSQLLQALPPPARRQLHEVGVQAEICGSLLAADGHEIPALENKMLAIRPDQLRMVPRVLAVAGGTPKTSAIRATLRSGLLSGLVTDVDVAKALLKPTVDSAE